MSMNENIYLFIAIAGSLLVVAIIIVAVVIYTNQQGDSSSISTSGADTSSTTGGSVGGTVRPPACNTLQTKSSCDQSRCNWTDGKYKSCSGEGSEGWSCSHFKDVDNSSNKCDRADGCHSVYTGNWGRNREFSECVGFQAGTGHKCVDFDEDEELCGDRSGCKPKYSNGTCADP